MRKIKEFIDRIVRAGNPDPLRSAVDHLTYLDEECCELSDALHLYHGLSLDNSRTQDSSYTALQDRKEYSALVETIDGVCDVAFVAFNIGLQALEAAGYGDKATEILEKCFEEVKDSNLSKLENGKPVFRADGKVSKGKDYFEPKIRNILLSYML